MSRHSERGFTLLEILLVIAIIAILAGIIIFAINPSKQLADARDIKRRSDVNAISNAITQYFLKTGSYPTNLKSVSISGCSATGGVLDAYGICANGQSCSQTDLSVLVPTYIASMPSDPLPPSNTLFSGYETYRDSSTGRVVVCANLAENASTSVTR